MDTTSKNQNDDNPEEQPKMAESQDTGESVDQFLNTLELKDFEESPQGITDRKLPHEELMIRVRTQGVDSITHTDLSGYDPKEEADPALLEFVFDNVGGFDDPYLRRITRHHMIEILDERKQFGLVPMTMSEVENDVVMFSEGCKAGKIATVKEERGISQEEMEADKASTEILTRGGVRENYPGELRQVLFWERLKENVPDLSFMDEADRAGLRTCTEVLVKHSTPYGLSYDSFRMGIAYERQRQ